MDSFVPSGHWMSHFSTVVDVDPRPKWTRLSEEEAKEPPAMTSRTLAETRSAVR